MISRREVCVWEFHCGSLAVHDTGGIPGADVAAEGTRYFNGLPGRSPSELLDGGFAMLFLKPSVHPTT